jgi:hypothetical protein
VPITTNVVSSNPSHGEVYSIQHYVIKFVSDLRQIDGFLHHNITEILLKVVSNALTLTLTTNRIRTQTLVLIHVGTDCTGSCKFNYHIITITAFHLLLVFIITLFQ